MSEIIHALAGQSRAERRDTFTNRPALRFCHHGNNDLHSTATFLKLFRRGELSPLLLSVIFQRSGSDCFGKAEKSSFGKCHHSIIVSFGKEKENPS